MVNNGNWFAVSRLVFDHYVVGIRGRPYTEFEAWLWLLAQASFDQRTVINKGETVVLDPGQMMHARIYLSQVWDWTEDKVRWFLKRLENEAMITRFCAQHSTQRRTNQIQIITICNYSQYQLLKQQHEEAQHPAKPPANTQPTPSQHPEDNNLTLKQEDSPLPPKGGKRGSRLPSDWSLPTEWRHAAKDQFDITDQKITTEANAFRDYWLSEAGQKASKIDWSRAWMNWIRRKHPERATNQSGEKFWWQDPQQVAAAAANPERWQKGIRLHANGTWPLEKLGPPPGHPKCVVPKSIIDELGLTELYTPAGIRRLQ